MKLIIGIDLETPAFNEEEAGAEVRQVLKGEAAHFASFLKSEFKALSTAGTYRLRDSENNVCGSVRVEE